MAIEAWAKLLSGWDGFELVEAEEHPAGPQQPVVMVTGWVGRVAVLTLILGGCDRPPKAGQAPSESVGAISPPPVTAPAMTRSSVIAARKKYRVAVVSFDASQEYGTEFPYSDMVRVRITNGSDITLPTLTLLTKRFDGSGKMIGSSRAPAVPVRDLMPGEAAEVDFYPRGHLPGVERITVEIEQLIAADEEQFFEELKGTTDGAAEVPSADIHGVTQPSKPAPSAGVRTVNIGTLADSVLAWRGKAISSTPSGRDDQGLLVEWRYPDVTYLMGRRLQAGIEAYRVIKITPNH